VAATTTGAKLSEDTVKKLPVPARGNRVTYFAGDTVQGATAPRGFGVRVTKGGARAFILNYRVGAAERRLTIGASPDWSVLKAVRHARELRQQIDKGQDPLADRKASRETAPTVKTVADVLDDFAEQHLRKYLRTGARVERALNDLVKPAIGAAPIYELRRSAIAEMLDRIETGKSQTDAKRGRGAKVLKQRRGGPVAADRTLAYLRKALNWYATRDDDFTSPIVRGMARTSATDRIRDRRLSDQEVRDVWAALDLMTKPAPFPRVMRALLLSAQRRDEVARMRWDEIEDDLWVIPSSRYKTRVAHGVPIATALRDVIGTRPDGAGPYVFTTTLGERPFSGHGKAKMALDAKIAELRERAGREPMKPWVLHDLRRTARTWLSEDRFDENVAEVLLGHLQATIRRTYNKASYAREKHAALDLIAARLSRILNPPAGNVAVWERRAAR
jgi:integrase